MESAHDNEKNEMCEPGANNAAPSRLKKYEMPGEKSKRASAAAEKAQQLAVIGKGGVVRGRRKRLTTGKSAPRGARSERQTRKLRRV